MNNKEIISSMKSITNQYIKNNTLNIFSFGNNCRVLVKNTELFTECSVSRNHFKNNVNQLKHFLQCEDCQNSLKKYVHDIDEYINQLERRSSKAAMSMAMACDDDLKSNNQLKKVDECQSWKQSESAQAAFL